MRYLLLLCLLIPLLSSPGCATTSRETVAYRTIGSIGSTADAAIGAYSDYIQKHSVPRSQIDHVRALVKTYLDAVEAVKTAQKVYQATKDSSSLDGAMNAVSAASAEVVQFINDIITK